MIRFFLNQKNYGYLRGLAEEFGESSNAIRLELNRFEKAGLLLSDFDGNKKMYRANESHPLFNEIKSMVLKYIGIDKVLDCATTRFKNIKEIWITGNYSFSNKTQEPYILMIGNDLENTEIINMISNTQNTVQRNLKFIFGRPEEKEDLLSNEKSRLLLWHA